MTITITRVPIVPITNAIDDLIREEIKANPHGNPYDIARQVLKQADYIFVPNSPCTCSHQVIDGDAPRVIGGNGHDMSCGFREDKIKHGVGVK